MANLLAQGINPECEFDNTDVHNNVDWKMVVDSSMSIQQRISGGSWIQRQEWTQDTLTIQNTSGCTLELQDGSSNGYQLVYDTTDGLLIQEVGGSDPLVTIDDTTASFGTDIVLEGSTTNATLSNNGSSLDMAVGSSVLEVSASKIQCKEDVELTTGASLTHTAALDISAAGTVTVESGGTSDIRLEARRHLMLEAAKGVTYGEINLITGADAGVEAHIGSSATRRTFSVHKGTGTNPVLEVGNDFVTDFLESGGDIGMQADMTSGSDATLSVGTSESATSARRGVLEVRRNKNTSKPGTIVLRADDGTDVYLSVWKHTADGNYYLYFSRSDHSSDPYGTALRFGPIP